MLEGQDEEFPVLQLDKGTIKESLNKLMEEYVGTTTDWAKPSALDVSDKDEGVKISFSTMVPYDFTPKKGRWASLAEVLGSYSSVESLMKAIRKSKYEFF